MPANEFQPGSNDDISQTFPPHDQLINARVVREVCGGISDMCLWRWLSDPKLNFPQPIYIKTRRYWRRGDVTAWCETQR